MTKQLTSFKIILLKRTPCAEKGGIKYVFFGRGIAKRKATI
jgi:hypothetical protein